MSGEHSTEPAGEGSRGSQLEHLLHHLAHYLPAQGPIGVFIHHNTLHAFQHLPFEQAVVTAAELFGNEPYMPEAAYRRDLQRGRIQPEDVETVLAQEPNASLLPGRLDRRLLRRMMLVPGVRSLDRLSVQYHLNEGTWLTQLRPGLDELTREHLLSGTVTPVRGNLEQAATEQLFQAVYDRIDPSDAPSPARPARPRDGLLAQFGIDLDEIIHPMFIRLCAVYLDQGMAYWPMPNRELGFYGAVRELLRQPLSFYPEHLAGIPAEFDRLGRFSLGSSDAVIQALDAFGVPESQWENTLRAELLALAGWAGLMRRLEEEPALAPHEELKCSLVDFLAVRLTLNLCAAESIARQAGVEVGSWASPVPRRGEARLQRRLQAARVFDAAQLVGLSAADVRKLSNRDFDRFCHEVQAFGDWERRRVLHLAYERRHEIQILGPLSTYRQSVRGSAGQKPVAQVMFCIDEREESIRRQLEETDPEIATLGAAGFFGVAVDYKGIDDAHGVALCPVVVKPAHTVREKPRQEDAELHELRVARRRSWAAMARNLFVGSRTLVRGWISTAFLGMLTLFPLIAKVLTPLQFARIRERLNRSFLPEPRTELTLMRNDTTSHDAAEGLLLGFAIAEKVDRVASVLAPAGLTRDLADMVVVLGHGSTSLNNPHESAHDCGACGGRRGGPNARLFAAMANHPEVREGLQAKGIHIPDTTWFVGGYHDTCNDDVDLYDTDQVPASHLPLLARVRQSLDRARALNAHERSRRFEAAASAVTPGAALLHVEERSEHLAEPRPEYGHATNAVCIVGRREWTRGLFMDRRAFLVSYDPLQDPTDQNLGRLLGAVVPVCAGISLEYYFSFVDNERYGCGTKLPHNITGLVGVMNGHASDLRTGLPWQMVEVHEPVRILFVIETTPERLGGVIAASPALTEFVANRWVRVATMDPETGTLAMYRDGTYVPFDAPQEPLPSAPTSVHWYRGKLEHLPLAKIGA